jgi:hypothetical protein
MVPSGKWGRGGRTILWAFCLADIAHAAGLTVRGVREAIRTERLDPGDLTSLAKFLTADRLSRRVEKKE